MSTSAISSANFAEQYAATVERKIVNHIQEQGQQSLRLIASAANAPANVPANVGQKLNITA